MIAPDALVIDPMPPRGPNVSIPRLRARELRAWRRGARPGLTVTHEGRAVTPDQIDWAALPRESSSPGGRNARAPRSVRLSVERERRLEELAARWSVNPSEAIGRAIDEAFCRTPAKSDR